MKYNYHQAICFYHKMGSNKEKEEYIVNFTGEFLEHPTRGLIYVMHQFYSDDGTIYFYGFGLQRPFGGYNDFFDKELLKSGSYICWEISSYELTDDLAYGLLRKITKEDFCARTDAALVNHLNNYKQTLEKCIKSINK